VALVLASALMAAAHAPYYTFYSIHLVDHGYSKGLTGWLWALGVICEIGIFVWMPRLYRAFTLKQILIASFALAVLRFLLIGWGAASLLVLLLAQALHAATFGSFHAAAIGVVHRLFRGRHQARGQAIYGSLSFGVGGTLGGFASGYGWDYLGAGMTFSLASGCALTGMLIIWWKLRLAAR
jgi:PPP family 3-phenylpropionic acid transporter